MTEPTNPAVAASPVYASFWKRLYAYGYDSIIVTLLSLLVSMQLPRSARAAYSQQDVDLMVQAGLLQPGTTPETMLSVMLAQALASITWMDLVLPIALSAIYTIAFTCGKWQATPGKRFCGIMVTNADGSRLTLVQSAYRHAASGLSMLVGGLGYITIFFTREKLAPHDMLCGTRVVIGKTST